MKHALVGSGEYLPPMDAVDRALLARLGTTPRVVCLPTAAGTEGEAVIARWSEMGEVHFRGLGVTAQSLRIVDRAAAADPAHVAAIAAANFVYLSGGKPDFLYTTLVDTPAWAAIEALLARGGLLAGCSAGAMVQGAAFFGFPGKKKGFGLFPGVTVLPHFDEIPGAMVRGARLLLGGDLTLVGVEGNTALLRDGDGFEVLGRGGVTVWNERGKERYAAGPLPAGVLPTPS